jgi:dimethylamine monooxygenase subunit A
MYAQAPPAWLDELDLKQAPPHVRMGTHALDMNTWFVVDQLRTAELGLRSRLIGEQRDEVVAVRPTAEAACVEVRDLVVDWLRSHDLAVAAVPDTEHPLVQAGLMVQDDLCVMVHRDGDWHLDAAVLCFPSVWRLRDKIGKPTAAVHQPVVHYESDLRRKVDRFFDRLTVDRPVWRRNVSLKPSVALYLPSSDASSKAKRIDGGPSGIPQWIRTERQTLRRLPQTGAILFTIRTQFASLDVLRHRPDRARDLLAMYRSWDAEASSPLISWLEAASSDEPLTP